MWWKCGYSLVDKIELSAENTMWWGSRYRNIRSLINTQSYQFSRNLMLRRMSLVGLMDIPMLVSALNSTIIFLF